MLQRPGDLETLKLLLLNHEGSTLQQKNLLESSEVPLHPRPSSPSSIGWRFKRSLLSWQRFVSWKVYKIRLPLLNKSILMRLFAPKFHHLAFTDPFFSRGQFLGLGEGVAPFWKNVPHISHRLSSLCSVIESLRNLFEPLPSGLGWSWKEKWLTSWKNLGLPIPHHGPKNFKARVVVCTWHFSRGRVPLILDPSHLESLHLRAEVFQ